MKKADEFKLFLATHLLWVRSAKPIGSQDITYLREALAWIFSPQSWQQDVYSDFSSSLEGTPFRWALCLIVFGLLLFGKRWARGELKRTAHLVSNFETDSFSLTVWAFVATIVLVAAWPFLFYTSARILADMPFADSFTRDVCAGIKRVALWFAAYSFLYYVCHRDGLGQSALPLERNDPVGYQKEYCLVYGCFLAVYFFSRHHGSRSQGVLSGFPGSIFLYYPDGVDGGGVCACA